jgi:hypothetical protein
MAIHATSTGGGCAAELHCGGYSAEIHNSVFNVSGGNAVTATESGPVSVYDGNNGWVSIQIEAKVRIFDTTLISTTPANNMISGDIYLDILLVQVMLSWIGPFSEGSMPCSSS